MLHNKNIQGSKIENNVQDQSPSSLKGLSDSQLQLRIRELARAIILVSLGSSIRESQRMLEAKAQERRPSLIAENPNQPTISFQADEETIQMLERLRELRGNPGALELFKLSLKTTLDKLDPLRKKQKAIGNRKPDPSLFAQKLTPAEMQKIAIGGDPTDSR